MNLAAPIFRFPTYYTIKMLANFSHFLKIRPIQAGLPQSLVISENLGFCLLFTIFKISGEDGRTDFAKF